MPWKETNPMNQKALFIADYLRNIYTITELCEIYQINRKTAYKWINRYLQDGPFGLEDHSRKPIQSPQKTDPEIERLIIKLRHRHPTWGAKKLAKRLSDQYPHLDIPARSTLCAILKRNQMITNSRKRRKPAHPGKPIVEMLSPNQTWCADFKGEFKTLDGQYCYPLTITDGYSRYLIACTALHSTALNSAKMVFKSAFKEFGLPKVILTDNGTPFAANSLSRLTRLSIWWIQLGITPTLIQPGRPNKMVVTNVCTEP